MGDALDGGRCSSRLAGKIAGRIDRARSQRRRRVTAHGRGAAAAVGGGGEAVVITSISYRTGFAGDKWRACRRRGGRGSTPEQIEISQLRDENKRDKQTIAAIERRLAASCASRADLASLLQPSGEVILIGDIHGHAAELEALGTASPR